MGRIDAWDKLKLGMNYRFLEFGTNCRLGRIAVWAELSLYAHTRAGRQPLGVLFLLPIIKAALIFLKPYISKSIN